MKIKLAAVPVLVMAVFTCSYVKAHAQACSSTEGASNGASFSTLSNPGSTFSWSNPGNAQNSDGTYATASRTLSLITSQHSDYLTIQNFGFSIPSTATICEIHVTVERSATGINILNTVSDESLMLLKNGSLYGNDLASGTAWPGSDGTVTYGNGLLASTWGGSWLPADVNSSNFGVAIAIGLNGLAGVAMTGKVDEVQVTVIYDPNSLLATALENFTAVRSSNGDGHLSWSAGAAAADCKYIVQRSGDSRSWQDIATVKGSFSYTDHTSLTGASFYRLRVESMDGRYIYSEVKEIVQRAASLRCWPNPFGSVINVAGSSSPGKVIVKDIQGRVLYLKNISAGDCQIPAAHLPPGLYFVEIGTQTYKMLKQQN